ncbi:MAG: ABC transporter substrate-binding protein, partial [Clostridia bacterium]
KLEINGAIYGLPKVLESAGQRCLDKMWVYMPWLEKLNLEMPETTEEFYQMLKAFKEQDPNGNGVADEVPLAGRGIYSDTGIEDYLMNAFTYSDTRTNRLYVEDGKVLSAATTDGYREGLRYLKKLYDEGLLLKDTFIIDRTRLTAIGENEGVPLLGACAGQWPGMFTLSGSDSGRIREYLSIPPLEGPTGLRQTPRTDITANHGTMFNVTSACENPELALKWVDWLYSNEGRITQQGVSNYREAREGEIGLNGKQAKYAYDPKPADDDSATFGMVQNQFWGANFGVYYFDLDMVSSEKLLEDDLNVMLYHEAIDKYFEYVVDKSYPILPIDTSLASEYTDLETTIREAVDKAVVAFVTGERNLDTEWEAYLSELEGYGLSRYLELSQERYDTYKK